MEIYDLRGEVDKKNLVDVREQLTKPLQIRGLKDSSLNFVYDDGEVQFIPTSDSITEFDFSAWLPLTTAKTVDTIKGMYMSNNTVALPNIVNIIIQDISVISSISDWMFDELSEIKTEKIISYLGRPVSSEVIVEGVVNRNIVEINLPLNQNLVALCKRNPQIRSVGINADLFNYWNLIPQVDRIVVFASNGVTVNMANYYLKGFRGEVLVVVW